MTNQKRRSTPDEDEKGSNTLHVLSGVWFFSLIGTVSGIYSRPDWCPIYVRYVFMGIFAVSFLWFAIKAYLLFQPERKAAKALKAAAKTLV
jgi:hypothetical protein